MRAIFQIWEITLQSSDLIWGINFLPLSLPIPFPSLIFSYLQALIHGFLWWWTSSWLIFSLKWNLQSPFLFLHSIAMDLQKAKDSIDEEDLMPTSSTWSYITFWVVFHGYDEVKALIWGRPLFEHKISFFLSQKPSLEVLMVMETLIMVWLMLWLCDLCLEWWCFWCLLRSMSLGGSLHKVGWMGMPFLAMEIANS